MKPIVNATLRAIISIAVLIMAIGSIVWVTLDGDPHNSLHVNAQGWSYTMVIFTMLALGVESTASAFISAKSLSVTNG